MSVHDARYLFFVAKLTEARVSSNLTQTEVAGRLGKPQSFVSKYETAERRLDVAEFLHIAEIVGLAIEPVFEEFFQTFPTGKPERKLHKS
jgi:transcriptional regulator with XRE-family HTH domain